MVWLAVMVLKSTAFLSAGALCIALVNVEKIKRVYLCRLACVLVLLQGWCWFTVEVPKFASDVRPTVAASTPDATEVTRMPTIVVVDSFESPVATAIAEPMMSEELIAWGATIFVAVWLSGIVHIVTRGSWNYYRFHRQLRLTAASPRLTNAWHSVCRECKIPTTDVAVSKGIGPAVMQRGWRTVLVVPGDLSNELSEPRLRGILIHESAHIARRDIWKSLAVRILAGLHWFNPCAWLVVRQFDEAAEWACDAKCQSLLSDDITEFARAILENVSPTNLPSLSFGVRGHRMSTRIRRMLFPEQIKESRMRIGLMCMVFTTITAANVVEPVSWAFADEHQQLTSTQSSLKSTDAVDVRTAKPEGDKSNPMVIDASPDSNPFAPKRKHSIDNLRETLQVMQKEVARLKHQIHQNENGVAVWEIQVWECTPGSVDWGATQNQHRTSSELQAAVNSASQAPRQQNAAGSLVDDSDFRQLMRTTRRHAQSLASGQGQPRPGFHSPLLLQPGARADLQAQLNDLSTNGTAQLTLHPKLVMHFGEPSQLFSGTEVPVVVPVGGNNKAIEWQALGVKLDINALRLGDQRIRSEVMVSFTEQENSAHAVGEAASTSSVSTRKLDTSVEQKLGETLIIRGRFMLQDSGKTGTEIIVLMTPELIENPSAQTLSENK